MYAGVSAAFDVNGASAGLPVKALTSHQVTSQASLADIHQLLETETSATKARPTLCMSCVVCRWHAFRVQSQPPLITCACLALLVVVVGAYKSR
jgi:hypothetical protein